MYKILSKSPTVSPYCEKRLSLKNHTQQKEEPGEGIGRGRRQTKTKTWRKV